MLTMQLNVFSKPCTNFSVEDKSIFTFPMKMKICLCVVFFRTKGRDCLHFFPSQQMFPFVTVFDLKRRYIISQCNYHTKDVAFGTKLRFVLSTFSLVPHMLIFTIVASTNLEPKSGK